jgi:hypothetical protein
MYESLEGVPMQDWMCEKASNRVRNRTCLVFFESRLELDERRIPCEGVMKGIKVASPRCPVAV